MSEREQGHETGPKPFVFVLMPFTPDFDDVYNLGIKPACQRAGAYAERVDEQLFEGSILERVYNQIYKSDVIVADMTGRNPNVFYETGYAHALKKPVILLTQRTEDIPFDLQHYPHIIYGGRITDLIPELVRRVTWAIERSSRASRLLDLEQRQREQERELRVVQVIVTGMLTEFEVEKLRGLVAPEPFIVKYHGELYSEIKRLDQHRYVRPKKDAGLFSIHNHVHDQNEFDLKIYYQITERGRDYLDLLDSLTNE